MVSGMYEDDDEEDEGAERGQVRRALAIWWRVAARWASMSWLRSLLRAAERMKSYGIVCWLAGSKSRAGVFGAGPVPARSWVVSHYVLPGRPGSARLEARDYSGTARA